MRFSVKILENDFSISEELQNLVLDELNTMNEFSAKEIEKLIGLICIYYFY